MQKALDHAGPMARSVDDLAFLLQAMAGHDPSDQGSADVAVPDYVNGTPSLAAPFALGSRRNTFLIRLTLMCAKHLRDRSGA